MIGDGKGEIEKKDNNEEDDADDDDEDEDECNDGGAPVDLSPEEEECGSTEWPEASRERVLVIIFTGSSMLTRNGCPHTD